MLKQKIITMSIFAGCLLTLAMSSTALASNLAKVTATSVNLRSYNSTQARILGSAKIGETLTITGNANNGWFKVNKPGVTDAFVNAQYISIYQTDATCISDEASVRTNPSATSIEVGKAKKGQVFVTSGKYGNWYQIKFNGMQCYIHSDNMQGSLLQYLPEVQAPTSSTETTATLDNQTASNEASNDIYAVVEVPSLNLREFPNTNSKILRALTSGYNLSVIGYEDGWILVEDDDKNQGFVKAEYINLKNGKKPENTNLDELIQETITSDYEKNFKFTGDVDGRELIEYSKQFLGTPYVWGGTDLTSGVDCSGFIYSVYKNFGITLNRTSRDMFTQGVSVSKSELVPGDLIFFNTGGNSVISHVAMYVGDGKYIHSPNGSSDGVTISSLNDNYSVKNYVGAKRILK